MTALNKMFLTLPLPTANADPEEALRVYYEVCQGYSNADVDLAVQQFIEGTVVGHNPSFAPTAAQFSKQLRENLNYVAEQNQRRNNLLTQMHEQEIDEQWQKRRTPEAKAYVKSVLDAMKAKETEKTPEELAQAKEDIKKHDAFYAYQFEEQVPGVKVSSYLIKKLGYESFDSREEDDFDMGGRE